MKKKKRYLIIISTVLFIMLISGIGFIIAGGPGRFCGDGFHPGFHHRDIRKHILARMDSRAQQLDLREDQT